MLTAAWHYAALANTSQFPKTPSELWTEQKPNVVSVKEMISALKASASTTTRKA